MVCGRYYLTTAAHSSSKNFDTSPKVHDKVIPSISKGQFNPIFDFPTEFCKGLESLEEPASSSYRELCHLLALGGGGNWRAEFKCRYLKNGYSYHSNISRFS